MNPKLLLVTDRADRARLQAQMLEHSGIEVSIFDHTTAKNKVSFADMDGHDLLLLNMFEEDNNGLALCRKLRAEYHKPILVLTHEHNERFLLRAYEAGADDCLVQPMTIHLLVAKVQAWLRRSGSKDQSVDFLEAYEFRFNSLKNEVITPQDTLVRLSQLEARLLHLLIVNRGRIVETDLIMQRVWPESVTSDGDRHLLRALVHRLRRKIEGNSTAPQYIHAIPRQGYTFHPDSCCPPPYSGDKRLTAS